MKLRKSVRALADCVKNHLGSSLHKDLAALDPSLEVEEERLQRLEKELGKLNQAGLFLSNASPPMLETRTSNTGEDDEVKSVME